MKGIPEFNESILKSWQIEYKGYLYDSINNIIDKKTKYLDKIMNKLINADNIYETLKYSEELLGKRYIINSCYSEFKILKDSLDIPIDSEDISIDEKLRVLCETDYDYHKSLLNDKVLIPKKGTYSYCKCKGYTDMTRVEMGRFIKKVLNENYPGIKWSVTSDGEYWCEKIYVKADTAYSIKEKYGSLYMGDDFVGEITDFLFEFSPRVNVVVLTELKKKD